MIEETVLTPEGRGARMSGSGEFKAGLEDVVVSTSDICFIDGREGRLLYRGYDVNDLVEHSSFERWCTSCGTVRCRRGRSWTSTPRPFPPRRTGAFPPSWWPCCASCPGRRRPWRCCAP